MDIDFSAEQLGEILADFEVRLSTLENSMPRSYAPGEITIERETVRLDQQVRAELLYLRKKVNELEVIQKKRSPNRKTNVKGLTDVYK